MRWFGGGSRCVRLLAALSLLGVFAAPLVAGGANPAGAAAAPPRPRASVPPTPINLKAYSSYDYIVWTWDNVDRTASVSVSDGTTVTALPPGESSFRKYNYPLGSYGCLSVSAWNEAGSSPWSDWICYYVTPLTPLNFHVSGVTASTVSFAWQNTEAVSYISAWEFRWNSDQTNHLLGQNATSYTATGLPPGYYVCAKVNAYNASTSGSYTNWECAQTPPATPSGVHRSSSTSTSVTFTWANQDQWSWIVITSDSVHLTSLGANAGTYTQTGMTPGSWACISVVAVNHAGTSNYTNWACGQAV